MSNRPLKSGLVEKDAADSGDTAPVVNSTASLERLNQIVSIVNGSPMVIFLWRIADGWPVDYVSDNVSQWGYTAEDFTSGRVRWPGVTHPDDLPRLEAEVADYRRRGITEFTQEYRLLTRDGEVRWVDDRTMAVRDDRGEITHFAGAVRDVTRRRHNREQRRNSDALFRSLVENLPFEFFALDAAGLYTASNEKCRAAWGDIVGKSMEDVAASPQTLALWLDAYKRALAGEVVETKEWRPRPDAETILHTILAPIRVDEQIRGALGMNIDVTRQKQAEAALRKQNDQLEDRVRQRTAELRHRAEQLARLASELALALAEQRERQRLAELLHDHLQQLLVGALYTLEATMRTKGDPRKGLDRVVEAIHEAIRESRSLTAELSPQVLHKKGLAAGLKWLAEWMGQKHSLAVQVDADPAADDPREEVRVLLFQSVRELLFNVVKHANARGAKVELKRADGCLQTVVSDDGDGFDLAEVLRKSGEARGGFGLFSIQERLATLGGRMEIESSPAHGSRFTMRVPIEPA